MQYHFDWGVIYQYRELLLQGVLVTIWVSCVALVVSMIVGIAIAIGRQYLPGSLSFVCAAYTEIFRNIPPIVEFFFWYFAIGLDGFPAAVIGLSAFTSSHVAEIVRSGIGAIPSTQIEAARSSGMTLSQSIFYVILPQALARVVPALGSEAVNIVKNSAVAMTIGYAELTFQTHEIEAQTFRGFEAATAATILYALIGIVVLSGVHTIERLVQYHGKAH